MTTTPDDRQLEDRVGPILASYARQGVSTLSQPPVPAGIATVRPTYQALISTSYEVDFWGRLSRTTEAARANLLANRLSIAAGFVYGGTSVISDATLSGVQLAIT